ncbi:MAG: adenylyl-sulfate kinase [Bacteroidetes bacterium]|nr:adenylyl-sulfate kinase [Bacteroidota bacterium]
MSIDTDRRPAPDEKARVMGQQPLVVWFTGLSGSGKTTLASGLEKILFERGVKTFLLDGDRLRAGLNRDLGFSPEDREENIRRAAEIAAMMCDAGVVVLASFISPYQKDRDRARQIIGSDRFMEVYLDCTVDVCRHRDVKGLYKKADSGEIEQFTGLSAPYEAPINADLTLETASQSIDHCLSVLLNKVLPRIAHAS